MLNRFLACLIATLILATLVTSCKKAPASADSGATAAEGNALKILHYGNGAEPVDLDPHVVTGVVEHRLILALSEGLVSEDPDLKIVPAVAERWAISPDGLVYTFHLRASAKWSNGNPVTAHDFVGTYRRMLTPALGGEYAYMLYHVVGAEDYHRGKLTDFTQTGFKALDAGTLQLTLRQPTPFLLHALNHYAWYPLPIDVLKKFNALALKGTPWTRAQNFVGNGPFVIKEWKTNQKLVVERSPTYWDRANVKLDQIHFYPIESIDTEERMFRTGKLHVTNEVPLSKIATYRRDMPESLRIEPYNGVHFYRFNVKRKPFDDVRVRRALAMAVDRESLVKNVMLADEKPAYHLIPPGVSGFTSEHRFTADVAEAKRLLAEAGYPDGKDFPAVDLLYNTSEKHRIIAEAIQQMWRQNLGITINLYNQEWKVYLDAQHTQNYQLQRAGWIADYVDPHVFLDLWETGGGNNDTNWGNPEYDRLLKSALAAPNDTARYAIYQQMEKILLDEMPIMPFAFYTRARLISPKVIGYHTTLLDNYPWKHADIKN